jgi:hypothetical protein
MAWRKAALWAVVGLGALVLVGATAEAQCRRPPPPEPPTWDDAAFRVTLVTPDGDPFPAFRHHGRTYVEGELGRRYAVRLANRTSRRVEAVVSVDGRDAVSGQPADYVSQRGYIVPAHGSVLIQGFRRSLARVAAFRFSSPEDSYSARMGTPENVGVVGVAFFRESEHLSRPLRKRHPPAPAAARSRGLGTEYGEDRYSPAVEVPFRRADRTRPSRIVLLYYDDSEGLAARGIYVLPEDGNFPEAFPDTRFAQPPAGSQD